MKRIIDEAEAHNGAAPVNGSAPVADAPPSPPDPEVVPPAAATGA
jgi:hypothetical protein